jgi:hypothetical protein
MTWALNLEHQGTLDSIVECQGVKQGWVVPIASQSLGHEVDIGTINKGKVFQLLTLVGCLDIYIYTHSNDLQRFRCPNQISTHPSLVLSTKCFSCSEL